MERDSVLFYRRFYVQSISTHALTWSATYSKKFIFPLSLPFQLTRSRGARQVCCENDLLGSKIFQLTRSRGARLVRRRYIRFNVRISTHALTWSATFRCLISFSVFDISTHALTWSATTSKPNRFRFDAFQLTRSRGARLGRWIWSLLRCYFNSRAHVERDRQKRCQMGRNQKFQLTRSRGTRRALTRSKN